MSAGAGADGATHRVVTLGGDAQFAVGRDQGALNRPSEHFLAGAAFDVVGNQSILPPLVFDGVLEDGVLGRGAGLDRVLICCSCRWLMGDGMNVLFGVTKRFRCFKVDRSSRASPPGGSWSPWNRRDVACSTPALIDDQPQASAHRTATSSKSRLSGDAFQRAWRPSLTAIWVVSGWLFIVCPFGVVDGVT